MWDHGPVLNCWSCAFLKLWLAGSVNWVASVLMATSSVQRDPREEQQWQVLWITIDNHATSCVRSWTGVELLIIWLWLVGNVNWVGSVQCSLQQAVWRDPSEIQWQVPWVIIDNHATSRVRSWTGVLNLLLSTIFELSWERRPKRKWSFWISLSKFKE